MIRLSACLYMRRLCRLTNANITLLRMILKFETYRIEVYWVGNQKKAGIREKLGGRSLLNMSYPSYTILIRLCNWAVTRTQ